jgi:hypothetical protein
MLQHRSRSGAAALGLKQAIGAVAVGVGTLTGLAGVILSIPFIGLLLILPTIITESYAAMKLWGWFIAPTFGLAALTYSGAMGIVIMAQFIRVVLVRHGSGAKKDAASNFQQVATLTLYPLLLVLVGWLAIHIF